MGDDKLKKKIIKVLNQQGFKINPHVRPAGNSKITLRRVQKHARHEQINIHQNFLQENTRKIKDYIRSGKEIDPSNIELELREVASDSKDEIIFKWWNLVWWSIPYQRPYGRQMRFILWDKTHDAPFGLIGLQSPILNISVRDQYLKIPNETKDIWINKSMQAQRVGALPPYNLILGGKMVSMALTSNEIRNAYKIKYANKKTLMESRVIDPDLLFITTTSAFGRSSIYNRLKYKDEIVAINLGFTKGYGTFHIPQHLYTEILNFLSESDINVSTTFGNGPSRKIKLLDKAFSMLGISGYTNHNIRREFYLFPLAKNLNNVISKNVRPIYYNRKLDDLANYWKERWCLPRSERFTDWKSFNEKRFLYKTKQVINNSV